MAGQYPKLVNKQFNSPINMYSANNIREVLDRETRMLSNGAVGINFHNPMTNKPTNLQNSAVLRLLEEEEERQRNGQSPGLKRVAWPPPPDTEGHLTQIPDQDLGGPQNSSPGLQSNSVPTQQPTYTNYQTVNPISKSTPAAPFKPAAFKQRVPQSLIFQEAPLSPVQNQTPSRYSPVSPSRHWAPVHSPVAVAPQPQFPYQAPQQQYQSPSAVSSQYQPEAAQRQPQQQQRQGYPQQYQPQSTQAFKPVASSAPPPSTITLRQQAPVSQAPPPLITSQPATATLQGGKNMRGDLKWPPPECKAQIEADNQARIELAKGPVFRPRKVRKDYSRFFAQHALNSTYPGYKAPPGTQYYSQQEAISNY